MMKIYTNPNGFCHTDIIPEKQKKKRQTNQRQNCDNSAAASGLVQPVPGAEVLHPLHAARHVFGGIDVEPGDESLGDQPPILFVSLLAKNKTRLA